MIEESIYCVYQHIRLDTNQVFYVGIGNKDRPYDIVNRNKYWKNIYNLNKDYKIVILFENLTWKQCCKKEKWFIKIYGRKDLGLGFLCNLTDGGDGTTGRVFTKDSLERIGIHSKNRIRKRGYKANLSIEGRKAKSDYMKNRIFTDEIKVNMSKGRLGNKFALGHKLSDDVKDTIRSKMKCDIIIQYSIDGKFIKEFPSINYIKKNHHGEFDASCVKRVCKGIYKQHKGFVWKYKNK